MAPAEIGPTFTSSRPFAGGRPGGYCRCSENQGLTDPPNMGHDGPTLPRCISRQGQVHKQRILHPRERLSIGCRGPVPGNPHTQPHGWRSSLAPPTAALQGVAPATPSTIDHGKTKTAMGGAHLPENGQGPLPAMAFSLHQQHLKARGTRE